MNKVTYLLLTLALCSGYGTLYGKEGFCQKCESLREYHRKHPAKHEFYEDYLEELEQQGADFVDPSLEIPSEIQYIMHPDLDTLEEEDKNQD